MNYGLRLQVAGTDLLHLFLQQMRVTSQYISAHCHFYSKLSLNPPRVRCTQATEYALCHLGSMKITLEH